MSDREQIGNAFDSLADMDWWTDEGCECCMSCGLGAVPEEFKERFVFFHMQDAEAFDPDGNLKEEGMYLAHSGTPASAEIVDALKYRGLSATWDGDPGSRIWVGRGVKEKIDK